jgi:hypothetical protein
MRGEHGRMTTTLIVESRFCGPPESGNGGYSAGLLAAHLDPGVDGAVEVTLRAPVPLDRPLDVVIVDAGAELRAADTIVAAARIVPFACAVQPSVDFETATALAAASPMLRAPEDHPFPGCFVCGPGREVGDGMRLFPTRVPGRDTYAVAWTPDDVEPPLVWGALDCPSSYPMYLEEDPFEGPAVLGRMTAQIRRLPERGSPCVVMSWREAVEGRKMFTASALYDADGTAIASARATWIRIAPTP